jgi:hypothetical protein
MKCLLLHIFCLPCVCTNSGAAWAEAIDIIGSGAGLIALALIPFVGLVAAYAYKVATVGL